MPQSTGYYAIGGGKLQSAFYQKVRRRQCVVSYIK